MAESAPDDNVAAIVVLKSARSLAKAQFSRHLHQLTELCDDREVVNRRAIRDENAQLSECVDKVLHATDQLISVCIKNGQNNEIAKYQEDVDTMESQFSDIMTLSERFLAESRIEAPSQLRPSAEMFVLHTSPAHESGSMMIDSSWGQPSSGNVGQDLWRQLKRVSVPIFDGDKRTYEAWKAYFVECVDQAPMTAEYK